MGLINLNISYKPTEKFIISKLSCWRQLVPFITIKLRQKTWNKVAPLKTRINAKMLGSRMTDNWNWWCRIKMLSHRSVTSKKLNQLYCSFPIEMSNSHFNKKEFNITLHRNYIVTTLMWVLELEEQRCSAEQILKIPWRAWQSPPRPQARCRCSGAWSGSCRTSPGCPCQEPSSRASDLITTLLSRLGINQYPIWTVYQG